MLYACSEKLVKFFHLIVVCFIRILLVTAVLFIGTALLSIYSVIDFIDSMSAVYMINPEAGSAILIIFLTIPLISYVLEKGLRLYLQHK